jgi:hypothetical protein
MVEYGSILRRMVGTSGEAFDDEAEAYIQSGCGEYGLDYDALLRDSGDSDAITDYRACLGTDD